MTLCINNSILVHYEISFANIFRFGAISDTNLVCEIAGFGARRMEN
jgi:hypothetical protein